MPKPLRIFGFRKSNSTTTVFLPVNAIDEARFVAAKDFPSPLKEEVIRMTGVFSYFKNVCSPDRTILNCSAKTDRLFFTTTKVSFLSL